MPRFTKPVVEDENGELIIPGAYGAAPGGIIERRSTFEWDNEDRAAPAPLIDTDDLSVALSDDDAEPSSTRQRRNSTRTARTVATQETGATTETAASEDDKDDDEETGLSSSSSQQPSDDGDGEDEGPPEHALPTEEVLTAHVVAAPPPPKSSVWARMFGCSKQASAKESRIRMAVFIGLAIALGMIVLVTRRKRNNNSLFRGNKGEDASVGLYDPPSATLAKRADLGIQDAIAGVVVNATMLEPDWNSPYYEALYWILYEDTLQLTPSDATLQQRYLLATFYFATSATSAPSKERRDRRSIWKQCAAPEQPPMTAGQVDVNSTTKPELQCTHHVLTAEKPSQVYTTVPNSWRWLSPVSECEWAGVMCNDEGFVTAMELANYGLTGMLMEELAFLPNMEKLSLPYNDFLHGGIPSSFLGKLSTLELQYNQHDGMLELNQGGGPMEILNLAGNKLTGSIPTDLFTQLSTLRQVSLQENALTGVLPSTTSNGLQVLRLNDNQLSGSIPTTLVASPADTFRVLDVSHNEAMTGTIPSELGLATKLQTLALARGQFTGTLPLELYSLTKLQVMDLQHNQLSGTMATEIGRLSRLRQLYWQNNAFSGTLPTHLGRLTRIEELEIQGNNFTGVIPQQFCNMFDDGLPMALSVEVVADCGGSDMPTITCPDGCCSQCCHLGECTLDNFAVLGLNATGDKPVISTTSKSESSP